MDRAERGGGQELDDEVAVRDGVHRVGARPVEAERRGGRIAVDRERRAGQRGGAQRAFVEPYAAVGEAPPVAAEHLDIGHHVVAEGDRLGWLQMGHAGRHGGGVALGLVDQRGLQRLQLAVDAVDRFT